jgi:hypothetical protein
MRPGRAWPILALVIAAAAAPSPALAADPTPDERAAAQVLFDEGRRLMKEKHFDRACPKFEESQKLDPGLGTLLNLAECQAQTGRTASAWTNFLEAAYKAKAEGQASRENTARGHAAALEPRLSKITILAVTGGQLEIKRDGVLVSATLLGSAVPVDPGEHEVTATAPGKKPWKMKIVVKPEGHLATVSVPSLDDAEREPEPKPPSPDVKPPDGKPPPPEETKPPEPKNLPEVTAGKSLRNGGVALTVVGFLGLGAAAGFTAWAKIRLDDSNSGPGACNGNLCPQAGYSARTDAATYGNVATGAWIGGGVVAAAGIGLLTAASVIRSQALRTAVAPAVSFDPHSGGTLGVRGRF